MILCVCLWIIMDLCMWVFDSFCWCWSRWLNYVELLWIAHVIELSLSILWIDVSCGTCGTCGACGSCGGAWNHCTPNTHTNSHQSLDSWRNTRAWIFEFQYVSTVFLKYYIYIILYYIILYYIILYYIILYYIILYIYYIYILYDQFVKLYWSIWRINLHILIYLTERSNDALVSPTDMPMIDSGHGACEHAGYTWLYLEFRTRAFKDARWTGLGRRM